MRVWFAPLLVFVFFIGELQAFSPGKAITTLQVQRVKALADEMAEVLEASDGVVQSAPGLKILKDLQREKPERDLLKERRLRHYKWAWLATVPPLSLALAFFSFIGAMTTDPLSADFNIQVAHWMFFTASFSSFISGIIMTTSYFLGFRIIPDRSGVIDGSYDRLLRIFFARLKQRGFDFGRNLANAQSALESRMGVPWSQGRVSRRELISRRGLLMRELKALKLFFIADAASLAIIQDLQLELPSFWQLLDSVQSERLELLKKLLEITRRIHRLKIIGMDRLDANGGSMESGLQGSDMLAREVISILLRNPRPPAELVSFSHFVKDALHGELVVEFKDGGVILEAGAESPGTRRVKLVFSIRDKEAGLINALEFEFDCVTREAKFADVLRAASFAGELSRALSDRELSLTDDFITQMLRVVGNPSGGLRAVGSTFGAPVSEAPGCARKISTVATPG